MALTFLYQVEMKNEWDASIEDLLKEFWEEQGLNDPDVIEFTGELVRGILKNLAFIDDNISRTAINWSIKRMPCLDKNILRMAVFELLFMDNIPVLVSINEAIELAKKYSSEDSPRFINGVLHKIKEGVIKQ